MNEILINELSTYAEKLCKADDNIFGYGIWSHHIKPMIEIAKEIAKSFGADQEIVVISVILHDLAGIKDRTKRNEHHIYGAVLAEEILKNYQYPNDKIEIIKKCIMNQAFSAELISLNQGINTIA
jgi:uncharacterized protein